MLVLPLLRPLPPYLRLFLLPRHPQLLCHLLTIRAHRVGRKLQCRNQVESLQNSGSDFFVGRVSTLFVELQR